MRFISLRTVFRALSILFPYDIEYGSLVVYKPVFNTFQISAIQLYKQIMKEKNATVCT